MIKNLLSRREKIILTAIDIINDLGMQGLSTREIARRENIADSTLYRHFKSKDEIVDGVLEYYSHFDERIARTVEINGLNSIDGILFVISSLAEYLENYPALTSITFTNEIMVGDGRIGIMAKNIYHSRIEYLRKMVEQGQRNGEICKDIPITQLTDIIYGTFNNIVFRWRVQGYDFSLKKEVTDTLKSIMEYVKIKC